jgi:DNA polymerase III subunit chi
MTQIEFHILPEAANSSDYLCRLVAALYRHYPVTYLQTISAQQAAELDAALWRMGDEHFIPHEIAGRDPTTPARVLIGTAPPADHLHQLFIHTALALPDNYGRFERLIEVIHGDEANRAAGRDRYRHYRDRGYPLSVIKPTP